MCTCVCILNEWHEERWTMNSVNALLNDACGNVVDLRANELYSKPWEKRWPTFRRNNSSESRKFRIFRLIDQTYVKRCIVTDVAETEIPSESRIKQYRSDTLPRAEKISRTSFRSSLNIKSFRVYFKFENFQEEKDES